jgi:hypothetical protein
LLQRRTSGNNAAAQRACQTVKIDWYLRFHILASQESRKYDVVPRAMSHPAPFSSPMHVSLR